MKGNNLRFFIFVATIFIQGSIQYASSLGNENLLQDIGSTDENGKSLETKKQKNEGESKEGDDGHDERILQPVIGIVEDDSPSFPSTLPEELLEEQASGRERVMFLYTGSPQNFEAELNASYLSLEQSLTNGGSSTSSLPSDFFMFEKNLELNSINGISDISASVNIMSVTMSRLQLDLMEKKMSDSILKIEQDQVLLPAKLYYQESDTTKSNQGKSEDRQLDDEISPPSWAWDMVQAPSMWNMAHTGNGAKICVIDSGVEARHSGFDKNKLYGWDIPESPPWYEDYCGHGTHVTGTVAAKAEDVTVKGIAPNAEFFVIPVFYGERCGWAYYSTLLSAVMQCVEQKANVINMSLGGGFPNSIFSRVIDNIVNTHNVLPIAAAGNKGNGGYMYPAAYENVMSVAAVDHHENIARFSQINDQVAIAAPGLRVLSLYKENTEMELSGTSMAAPHVSGVAALLFGAVPGATAAQVREAMEFSAKDKGKTGKDTSYGFGIVQAKDAYDYLMCLRDPACDPPTSAPTPAPTAAPTARLRCINSPENWRADGDPEKDCAWFGLPASEDNELTNCDVYGDKLKFANKTANQACCVCGGGFKLWYGDEPSAAPTSSAAPSVTASSPGTPSPCVDDPVGWYDSDGVNYDCNWYSSSSTHCKTFGDLYENFGKTANEACCDCGGGRLMSEAPSLAPSVVPSTSSRPSSEPSTNPSSSSTTPPSFIPSSVPSSSPSSIPSSVKSSVPSSSPSIEPTSKPTHSPSTTSNIPSSSPSYDSLNLPTTFPSSIPSFSPSTTPPQTDIPNCMMLTYNTFFSYHYGTWIDGGSDTSIKYNPSNVQNLGMSSYVVELRDNSGSSRLEHKKLDLSTFNTVMINFPFVCMGMGDGDDFYLEVKKSSNWKEVIRWKTIIPDPLFDVAAQVYTKEVQNGILYNETTTFKVSEYCGDPTECSIRFRGSQSRDENKVYIDNISVYGCV